MAYVKASFKIQAQKRFSLYERVKKMRTLDNIIKPPCSREKQIEDFEYLLHHIAVSEKDGYEEVHHCYVFDHKANLFEQEHIVIKDGKAFIDGKQIQDGHFHIIKGLEPTQEIVWSDEIATELGIERKHPRPGMTFKEKAKEW